ncbi:flagellar motor switch protein FliN [Nocardioides mangrovicus]|uniref:Flagellar motor switch protein FliN n=1 Tax=Nocardioides mangrovicus TaxID=2478913 RepID=A0A3L8P269_9ACTN|nr:flagellar motor switch protein FliN [Nocardioides mangrovicus]RLV49385.1 flagellar motor switch protein FliN [Nocardioides mangrovicus]
MTVQATETESAMLEVAAQVVAVLPSATPLTAAGVQSGSPDVAAAFQGAVVAGLVGRPGRVAVLVGEELTEALAASPTPGVTLAGALQPALDAAAAAIGASCEAADEVATDAVSDVLGDHLVVPMIGTGFAAAAAVSLVALEPAGQSGAQAEEPAADHGSASGDAASMREPTPTPADAPRRRVTDDGPSRGIELLHGVDMELTVELGRTRMAVRDLLALAPGDVLELDRAAGSPADLLVNGRLIARGEVVVVDEDFGLRITQILDANG